MNARDADTARSGAASGTLQTDTEHDDDTSSRAPGQETRSILDIARDYKRRGWMPLPLKPDSKEPAISDWPNFRVTDADLAKHFNGTRQNIGVLTGEPSGGLIDIDLDCPEAVQVADKFYPDTATFGYDHNPRSHHIFQCPTPPATKTFKTPSKGMIVEFRSTEKQTVFPGSTYAGERNTGKYRGERIRWDDDREPAEVDGTLLLRMTAKLAATALLLLCYTDGLRDDIYVAVIGTLLREHMPEKTIDEFFEFFTEQAHDPERKRKRQKATYYKTRLDGNKKVPGFTRLCELIGKDNAEAFVEWMRIGTQTSSATTGESDLPIIAELNGKHAIVMVRGTCSILTEVRDPLSGLPDITLSHPQDLRYLYANRPPIARDKRSINVFDHWLRNSKRRQFNGIVFAPGVDVPGYYNLWRGFAVEPREGDCSQFLAHIRDNICRGEEELCGYVMTWFASMIQRPAQRPGTSIVFRGKQGVGKGIVAKTIGSLLGPHYVPIVRSKHLTGNFNAHLKAALLVFADEAFWAGDKQGEGALKSLITEDTLMIEFKGKDALQVRNHIWLLVASNQDWVVPAAFEERRFCVLDVGDNHIQDKAYFRAISEQIDNGGREALLYHLLHYDMTKVDLNRIPQTAALHETKVLSLQPVEQFWLDCLKEGFNCRRSTGPPEEGQREEFEETWEDDVSRTEFHGLYLQAAKDVGVSRRSAETALGIAMRKLVPGLRTSQTSTGKRSYRFPSLDACRAEFEKQFGGKIDWNDDDDDADKRKPPPPNDDPDFEKLSGCGFEWNNFDDPDERNPSPPDDGPDPPF